jgi:hypothetical protein
VLRVAWACAAGKPVRSRAARWRLTLGLHGTGARPPLTVVLVNNGGGGIFSFLPAAEQIPAEAFTELWATPQHVDLMGACT